MREIIASHLFRNNYDHVYQFGVFNGDSMRAIAKIFNRSNRSIKKFFGFDSFEGFPDTDENYQDCWIRGGLSSKDYFKSNTVDECVSKIRTLIEDDINDETDLILIPGFFSDSLTSELAETCKMESAALIDIDVDLYSSAIEVLEFVVQNKILSIGTLLWYDDWGGSPNWKNNEDGESLAHKRVCDMYNIECELLRQIGSDFPHVQRLYVVKEINN